MLVMLIMLIMLMMIMMLMMLLMIMTLMMMLMVMMMLVKTQLFIPKAAQSEPLGGSMSHFIYILQKATHF